MTINRMNIPFSIGLSQRLLMLTTLLLPYQSLNVQFTYFDELERSAPDFMLTDLEGNTHQLTQYEGQFVVLEWFNFRCKTVDRLYKSGLVPQMQQQLQDEGVVWLSITSAGIGKGGGTLTVEQLSRQVEKRGGNQEAVLIDESGHVGQMYGVSMVPFYVVVGPDGQILYEGAFNDNPNFDQLQEEGVNYVEAALDAAMEGNEVQFSTTEPYGCDLKYHR